VYAIKSFAKIILFKKMKTLTLFLIAIMTLLGCNQSADRRATTVKQETKDIETGSDTVKTKRIAVWHRFKLESDSAIAKMDNDLLNLQAKLAKANSKDRAKLDDDYNKLKIEIARLKEKIRQKNVAFDNDMQHAKDMTLQENEQFKKDVKNDIDKLGKSVDQLFKDDKK